MSKKGFNTDKNAPRCGPFWNHDTDIKMNMKIPLGKGCIRDIPSQEQGEHAVKAEAGDIKFN